MKKISIVYILAAIVGITACRNSDSSTIGTYENDEPAVKTEEHVKEKTTTIKTEEKVHVVAEDTAKTTINVSKSGVGYESKKGTGVSVDKNGVKVKSKDVDIKVNQ